MDIIPSRQAANLRTAKLEDPLQRTGYEEKAAVVLIYPFPNREKASEAATRLRGLPLGTEILPYRTPAEAAQGIKPEGKTLPVLVVRLTNYPHAELPESLDDRGRGLVENVFKALGTQYLLGEENSKRPMGIEEFRRTLENNPDFVGQYVAAKSAAPSGQIDILYPTRGKVRATAAPAGYSKY